jgi:S-adenosylmethionine synthetase
MSGAKPDDLLVAEDVLPGHPDRLADAIAEALVDLAVGCEQEALVGVEVGVHRDSVFVTGRVAAGRPRTGVPLVHPITVDLEALVAGAIRDAGYTGRWAYSPKVLSDLVVDALLYHERLIRRYSDDQSVTVGHAAGSPATHHLPPEAFAARRFRRALTEARLGNEERLGPDGKVLVALARRRDRYRLECLCASLQHAPEVPTEELHRLVAPPLEAALAELDGALPGVAGSWDPDRLRLNGAGDFSRGGPHGDNGLSGKKLVVDHYGPAVPIGGGALCGKDPHKVDRLGALRARQVAVRLVRDAGLPEATVTLVWQPGREAPDLVFARSGSVTLSLAEIRRRVPLPDLSIEGTFGDLELAGVSWRAALADGYFGSGRAWER